MKQKMITWAVLLACLSVTPMVLAETRSRAHETYANKLWEFLNRPGKSFTNWEQSDEDLSLAAGPKTIGPAVVYRNALAPRSRSAGVGCHSGCQTLSPG